jgi:hypothetical protein
MAMKIDDDATIELCRITKGEVPYAVIHALLPIHIRRFLGGRCNVFGKYGHYSGVGDSLAECKKLLLYQSHTSKQIVGEANIVAIRIMKSEDIISKYGKRFFLEPAELATYSKSRNRPLLVFELENIKRFSHPVSLRKSITMAGQYASKQMYDGLIVASQKSND